MPEPTELERTFVTRWRQLEGPDLETEYRFHPPRRWKFDFVHKRTKVAIECEGGTFSRGRHSRGVGYAGDCEKYNQAARDGWAVFRLTSDMIDRNPAGHLIPIRDFILERLSP